MNLAAIQRAALRCALFLLVLLVLPALARAATVVSGSVTPPLPWTSSTIAYIGDAAEGSLTVDGGSQLVSGVGLLGNQTGALGQAQVIGVGTRWDSQSIYVGSAGDGVLTVASGALLDTDFGYIGGAQQGSGEMTITGAGSQWLNAAGLYVGQGGPASLTVSDGAAVSTGLLYASLNDLHGDGAITVTRGGIFDADLEFIGATSAVATFGSGGTLTVTSNDAELGVGYRGQGSLLITEAATVGGIRGYLGYHAGSEGIATIHGQQAVWSYLDAFYVGREGSGTLRVENGGQLRGLYPSNAFNGFLLIGWGTGAVGELTVTGTGSLVTGAVAVDIGQEGNGSLRIENGGQAYTSRTHVGSGAEAHGELVVDGIGSSYKSDSFHLGQYGEGELTVSGGGKVETSQAFLGDRGQGSGTATVTGVDSVWTNTDWMTIGSAGSGTLLIESGGRVEGVTSFIASASGSEGHVMVTGAGSAWRISGELYIGGGGNATLDVSKGGIVTAKTLFASLDDVSGSGVIETHGIVLDGDLRFDATHGANQQLTFGTGGTLHFSVADANLGVGYRDAGRITFTDGVAITSAAGHLAYRSGSTATGTVSGVGTKWATTSLLFVGFGGSASLLVEDGGEIAGSGVIGELANSHGEVLVTGVGSRWLAGDTRDDVVYVGRGGSGMLDVEAGGELRAGVLQIGFRSGSEGSVAVTGGSSKLTTASALHVGNAGTGTLDLSDGAQATTVSTRIGSSASGNGTASIRGAGTRWQTSNNFFLGDKGTGRLNIDAGAEFTSINGRVGYEATGIGTARITGAGAKWTSSGQLEIGVLGAGTMVVAAGGEVRNTNAYLGRSAAARGDVTVKGAGSQWINSGSLYVGEIGSGTLTVDNGGHVLTSVLYASASDLRGNGTIKASTGAVLDANVRFDVTGSANTTVPFGSGGTLSVSATGGNMGVGYRESGTLAISNGATPRGGMGFLGYYAGAEGSALVTGANSSWNVSTFYIGREGHGELRIDQGSSVRSGETYLGYQGSASGQAVVTGSGSRWDGPRLRVGGNDFSLAGGTGSLLIEDGGKVSSSYSIIASGLNSSGTASVNGVGSEWTDSSSITVGWRGNASLRIERGGRVTSYGGGIASNSTSSSSVLISGPGSRWTVRAPFTVGGAGAGSLSLVNGGLLRADVRVTIDNNGGNDSFVNMATGGMLSLKGDADDSLTQFLGLVSGTDAIRYWNDTLNNWSLLTTATLGVDYTLQYLTTGDLAGYTLLTVGTFFPLPGDANSDGIVDTADYTIYRDGLGTVYTSDDLETWRANFGRTYATFPAALGGAVSVPEPCAIVLCAAAMISCFRFRGRQICT